MKNGEKVMKDRCKKVLTWGRGGGRQNSQKIADVIYGRPLSTLSTILQSESCLSIGTVGQEKRWDFLSILSSVLQASKVIRNPFGLKIILLINIK